MRGSRKQQLPEDEKRAKRRMSNTAAQRRCRERKIQKRKEMEMQGDADADMSEGVNHTSNESGKTDTLIVSALEVECRT